MSVSALQDELYRRARERRARLFGATKPLVLRNVSKPAPKPRAVLRYGKPIGPVWPLAESGRLHPALRRDVLAIATLPVESFVVPASAGKQIIRDFCQAKGVAFSAICSKRRDQPLVWLKQELWWLLKQGTKWSLPQIGQATGGRDHTTVMHGIRQHQAFLDAGGVRSTRQNRKVQAPLDLTDRVVRAREANIPHATIAKALGITRDESSWIYSAHLRRQRLNAQRAALYSPSAQAAE